MVGLVGYGWRQLLAVAAPLAVAPNESRTKIGTKPLLVFRRLSLLPLQQR